MFCAQCNMLIHDQEISWVEIYGEEYPTCPIHKESLQEAVDWKDLFVIVWKMYIDLT